MLQDRRHILVIEQQTKGIIDWRMLEHSFDNESDTNYPGNLLPNTPYVKVALDN